MAAILVGAVSLAVWFLITGAAVRRDIQGLAASAVEFQASLRGGDYSEAAARLSSAQERATSLNAALSSAPWSWAKSFPIVGASVTAGAVLADSAESVLAPSSGLLSDMVLLKTSDATAVAGLAQAAPALATTADAAQTAVARVSHIDTDRVVAPIREDVEKARTLFLEGLRPVADNADLAQVLPGLLGVPEPSRWLVLLGQSAESRGTAGGFVGAYASVDVVQGNFALDSPATNDAVAGIERDLSALPSEYQRLWGADAEYLWGFNLSRHYPYAAAVAREALDPTADYVVSFDPRGVAGLIALSGPVTVDGVTIDARNAESFFTHDIYVRYPNIAVKDQVTLTFLQEVFAALGSRSLDPGSLWHALSPVVAGSHVQIWSPDPAVAAILGRSPIGGAVPALSSPWVTVAFNNTAGNKADSYVTSSVEYAATGSCESGVVSGSVTASLELAQMPPGLPRYISWRVDKAAQPYGTSSMYVHIYGPSGAVARTLEVNGVPTPAVQGTERGHPVWGTKVQLAPGAPVVVRVAFEQPAFPGRPLVVSPQPMVQDTAVRVVDERSCGVE